MMPRIHGKAWAALRAGRGAVFGALALFVLISCMLDGEKTAKRGSEVENEIHGVLVAVDRGPVQGAKVKAVPSTGPIAKRGAAAGDSVSTVTDEDGKYSLQGLRPGTYNLFGESQDGDLVVLIPGVDHSDTTEPNDQGVDTLRAPGRIRGRVLLGEDGKPGVFAYVPGTSYLAVSDDSGRFVIAGVPQGIYGVRYSAPGFVIEPDSNVAVRSGMTTDLPVKRLDHDPALPPPAPTGLKAVYDTLNERVLLSWNSVPVSDLDGYVIYRDEPSLLEPQVLENGFTRSTTFIDSAPGAPPGMERRKSVYRIKSRDVETNLSMNFSAPAEVEVMSRQWVATRISIGALGSRPGRLTPGDTVLVALNFENPTRRNRRVDWFLDGMAAPMRSQPVAAKAGADTLVWVAGFPGLVRFVAEVLDDGNARWSGSAELEVLADPPWSFAGPDTLVSLRDSVYLRGKGTDGFGQIVKWEWDIGGTGGFRASGPDTVIQAPGAAVTAYPCILRVTDDDGQAALDTMLIKVIQDAPQVAARGDTTVSIGDTFHLQAVGTDGFGSIVDWKWDIGNTGAFTVPGPEAYVAAPQTPLQAYLAILQAKDDDGNSVLDTVVIRVLADPPRSYAGPDTTVSIGDSVRLHGRGSDGFGKVVSMEWSCGSPGTPIPTVSGQIAFRAPSAPTAYYPCIFRVTDDDGQVGLDTAHIRVEADPPSAKIGQNLLATAFQGEAVKLSGTGSHDGYGQIVKWEWSAGPAGTFRPSTGPETTLVIPAGAAPSYTFRLRVTDDDGMEVQDSLVFAIHPSGGKTWVRATEAAGYAARIQPVVLSYKENLFVIGGYDDKIGGGSLKDVWSSPDGKAWTRMKSAAAFPPRYGHMGAVFNGKMWIIGGGYRLRDIWASEDGVAWTQAVAQAPFPSRMESALLVFAGKMWLIGGLNSDNGDKLLNDIWSSSDGINWIQETGNGGFPARARHGAFVLNGRMWIVGGWRDAAASTATDVWSSANGKDWTRHPDFHPSQDRSYPTLQVVDGKVWLAGGRSINGSPDGMNDLHVSADGLSWTPVQVAAPFPARSQHASALHNGRIWIVGGMSFTNQGDFGDVWYSR